METRPQAKNLLDTVSPEDLLKIKDHQASTSGSYPLDHEWMLLAEFAIAYGWDAYQDARLDRISMAEMLTLIEASRKLKATQQLMDAQASFIGAGSAQTKKPAQAFKKLTKGIIKQMRVSE